MSSDYQNKIKELHIEDFIWLLYFFIIGFNIYSNLLEEEYIKKHDIKLKEKFRTINIYIFSIVLIIYIYFLITNYKRYQKIKYSKLDKQKELTNLAFIASIFFFLGGLLTLYTAIKSKNINDEIAII